MGVHWNPENIRLSLLIFLGGSITGAEDWQSKVIEQLDDTAIEVFNPRRPNFDVNDPSMEKDQIEWEFRHLRIADGVVFWFSHETLAPITLFELGRHSTYAGRPLFVGVHPDYKRKRDVQIQLSLVRPDIVIHNNLEDLVCQIKRWANQ